MGLAYVLALHKRENLCIVTNILEPEMSLPNGSGLIPKLQHNRPEPLFLFEQYSRNYLNEKIFLELHFNPYCGGINIQK